MTDIVVVTTSYPEHAGDAQGHFVAAEVRQLCERARVTVLAPGATRGSLFGERVVGLDGGDAFGFPGALERLTAKPWRVAGAARFVTSALHWLRWAPAPERVIAHFLLPCGVPIATRGLRGRPAALEIVVHGSDARLFARLPAGHGWFANELVRSGARLRFVSSELERLVLGRMPAALRATLAARSRVEPSAIDIEGVASKAEARRSLLIAESAKLAVIVARLVPGKRVDVALEACRRVASLQAVVIGDGPEREQLARQFPEARFIGHVERSVALAHIAAADVLVSASLNEGAPTVVREARALGTPVVALAAGDLRAWAANDAGLNVVG